MRAFPASVDLAASFISFEALHDHNKARKLAKELLRQNRADLRLWNEYARGRKSSETERFIWLQISIQREREREKTRE